jgi:hypothetical protein
MDAKSDGVSTGQLLKQRMAEGIKGGRAHGESFKAFSNGLEASGEVDVEAWRAWVDKWERERHVEGEKGSPYEYQEEGTFVPLCVFCRQGLTFCIQGCL